MKHLLRAACVLAVILRVSFGRCADQQAADKPVDTKTAASAVKSGTTLQSPSAQPPKVWTPAELGGTREPYAEITRAPSGKPILAIHYPWQVHERPSIEIRWLADNEADTADIRPLQFVASLMKGDIIWDIYQCRDKAAETPQRKTIKIQKRDFEILGDRNLLGRPAATVVLPQRPKDPKAKPGSDTDRSARAVFFPLDSWSLDSHTLWIELPAAHFAQPGRIRVWFYRQGNLVWWKTLAWPGLK